MKRLAFRVTGRVQGVSYRAGCARLAEVHGVHGWVRNVTDGAVEGRVGGPIDAVVAFVLALPHASAQGRVHVVATHQVTDVGGPGFEIVPSESAPTADWPPNA